jgi:hypothetical protein
MVLQRIPGLKNILNMWNNCFPQLLNVQSVSDIRQIETRTRTTELLVPDPSHFEVNISTVKL